MGLRAELGTCGFAFLLDFDFYQKVGHNFGSLHIGICMIWYLSMNMKLQLDNDNKDKAVESQKPNKWFATLNSYNILLWLELVCYNAHEMKNEHFLTQICTNISSEFFL